jgi:hypothetical protein
LATDLRRGTKYFLWALAGVLAIVGIAFIALLSVPAPLEHWLQARVLLALKRHYRRDVQMKNLHVTLVPVFRVTADDFVIPNRDVAGLPPFLTVKHVVAEAFPLQLLRRPVHVSLVKLDGLVINVPPKGAKKAAEESGLKKSRLADFVIDRVEADGTHLYVLPKQEGREPMEWELRTLTLRSPGIGQPMRYTAALTNPKPPGIIQTAGKFGPWNLDEPSETPVAGHYDFQNADLSVFNGISGILSSVGGFSGVLKNIVVDGTTETPDFKLDRGSRAVHLSTQFHAVVDGTNGNTYLQPVNAQFLNSKLVAQGEVAGKPGERGKSISLDVDIQKSRLQDLLELAVASSQPMVTGALAARAKLVIPPGNQTVLDKIELAGKFQVGDARFTTAKVKDTLATLSRRAQGRPDDQTIQDVPAQLSGAFTLRNATLTFSSLQFEVPGALANVKGSYGLRTEQIEFTGDVRLQAHVSQTMSGLKRVLLKPVDPLFARHGAGTYLPVNITGKRDQPQVKLDLMKVF